MFMSVLRVSKVSSRSCPTQRALDAGESARFTSIFLASAFFSSDGGMPSAPAQVTQAVGQPTYLSIKESNMTMNKRKKTPPATEADVLEKSLRRCCVCYALHRDFREKKGQIAHLDQDPANDRFDNLCFLCQGHHDDYDARRRQTKGLTLAEVKRYRNDLYNTVIEWKESAKAVNQLPFVSQILTLNHFEVMAPVLKKTTQGTQIVERQAGVRLADKPRIPTINLDVHFREMITGSHNVRILSCTIGLLLGLTIHSEVYAPDNWSINGFMNALRNNIDIWILHGKPLKGDEREPIMQPRDSLLVYHTSDGENRLIVNTHAISETPIQVHMCCSNKVLQSLANYLDEVGFSKPLNE